MPRNSALLLAALIAAPAWPEPLSADPGVKPGALDPHRPLAQELVASARTSVTLVGTLGAQGDLSRLDPAVAAWLSSDGANVTIGTLDAPAFDLGAIKAYPYPWGAAPVRRATPAAVTALRQAGFAGLLLATDHALDWGIEGMRATADQLDAAGIAHAGTGDNAARARAAAYVDERHGGGRIGIVSAATSFRPTSEALDQQGAAPGRPGVSAVALAPVRLVSAPELATLGRVACRFQHPGDERACATPTPADTVAALGSSFALAAAGAEGTTRFEANALQTAGLLHAIREGKESGDLLVAGLHAAQTEDERVPDPPVPGFLKALAHQALDAGADLVVVTGGPALGPVETDRQPGGTRQLVFYGLGQFLGQGDGAVVRTDIGRGGTAVTIHPIEHDAAGMPHPAARAKAAAMLERLKARSESYGSVIAIVPDGAGLAGRIVAAEGK